MTGDQGQGEDLIELDMDIIMKNTAQMPHARFPAPHPYALARVQ